MSVRFREPFADTGHCIKQLNLLAHAQLLELDIGSRCGGHGRCGGDRVRIVIEAQRSLLNPVTEAEREHLSDAELADGWRLACQSWPNQDGLTIDCETTT